jgi:hypothetical protein
MVGRNRAIAIGVVAALVCPGAAGCGTRTATVAGRVTYQNEPVANGSVVLYCSDQQIVRGNIAADGAYSIPNVPAGPAAVTVHAPARTPAGLQIKQDLPPVSGGPILPVGEHTAPAAITIPRRYALPEESGLRVVVEGGPVTYDIDLNP